MVCTVRPAADEVHGHRHDHGLQRADRGRSSVHRSRLGLGDSTSIDALQAFIVITAVPVTPLVLATLWSAPRLAWKEWQRTTVTSQ